MTESDVILGSQPQEIIGQQQDYTGFGMRQIISVSHPRTELWPGGISWRSPAQALFYASGGPSHPSISDLPEAGSRLCLPSSLVPSCQSLPNASHLTYHLALLQATLRTRPRRGSGPRGQDGAWRMEFDGGRGVRRKWLAVQSSRARRVGGPSVSYSPRPA